MTHDSKSFWAMPYNINAGTITNIVLAVLLAEEECDGKHEGVCVAE